MTMLRVLLLLALLVREQTAAAEYDVPPYESSGSGALTGELRQWHKITLGFQGQPTGETNNINPFVDLRLDVTFTHVQSGEQIVNVPGYYASDGHAANSGAAQGSVWLVHVRPHLTGEWTWTARYVEGTNVALLQFESGTSAGFFDGATGSFVVEETDKELPDLRARGRLQYVGEHHLQFAGDQTYFLKAGADSPENFLAYDDFDNTPNEGGWRKSWEPHLQDYVEGDPTWGGGKGRGIIGAVNYLSAKGMNVFSFLTFNVQGDDKNVFPFLSPDPADWLRIDVSKMAQWEVVFDHAESKGMFLHFKTQERENDTLLDEGEEFGLARKLYYRELIARFGHHLALNWNLGEENTNTDQQRKAFADYIKQIDPYDSPIVLHTWPGTWEENYEPLLGYPTFDGVSLQVGLEDGFDQTLQWVTRSAETGRKWIVAWDEQAPASHGVVPDADDPTHDGIRQNVLWANLMAGGAGVEYYFGYEFADSDLSCQNFRTRNNMWDQSQNALEFFANVPFWRMVNANSLVMDDNWFNWFDWFNWFATDDNWCLYDAQQSSFFVIYLRNGGTTSFDLSAVQAASTVKVQWFDPVAGGNLQNGSVTSISGASRVSIGEAPYNQDQDWAVLLTCENCVTTTTTTAPPVSDPVTHIRTCCFTDGTTHNGPSGNHNGSSRPYR